MKYQFKMDLVENSEDRFSHDGDKIIFQTDQFQVIISSMDDGTTYVVFKYGSITGMIPAHAGNLRVSSI